MSCGIPLDNVDPDNLDGYDRIAAPSKVRVRIQDVTLNEKGSYVVMYEVLACNVPGQEGKTGKEFFSQSPNAIIRTILLHIAIGLITREQIADMKRRREEWYPDWDAAVGRELVLELEKSKDGKYTNATFRGMYAINSKEAEGVPGCGPGAAPYAVASGANGRSEFDGAF